MTQIAHSRRRRGLSLCRLLVVVLPLASTAHAAQPASPAQPSAAPPPVADQRQFDEKPYDDRLMRLAELLGAVHYLRELCGATDGQLWRDRMREIMDAEAATPIRRARLTRGFNQGYRTYSRTYNSCTGSAQTTISRFLSEGSELAEGLAKTTP